MKAAFKKELMYFSRTLRMFGVIFAILIFALFDPIMYKGMVVFIGYVSEQFADGVPLADGARVNVTEQLSGDDDPSGIANPFAGLDEIYGLIGAEETAAATVGDFTSTSTLIILLILMQPSGGEQKKRSTIIPQCAGLTSIRYITPKFVIYPLTAFLSGLVAMPLCAGVSVLLFGGAIPFMSALASGATVGLYLAFLVVVELTIGISSARPGFAAIFTILGSSLLPTILALFRADRFHPFALPPLASELITGDASALNLAVSAAVTVVIGVILYFTTLLILNAKRIDNSGNEAVL
ncbi:MAG: hypothetical protein NC084_09955 [Bacteroides sp.]|nr:hypothetical protein [Eubacterium sp.]MCM1419371.1 hypothetical protein [Roseburia sp.]MCM1463022.1 hypothetical protein [Bacteroides sp.]